MMRGVQVARSDVSLQAESGLSRMEPSGVQLGHDFLDALDTCQKALPVIVGTSVLSKYKGCLAASIPM